MSAARDLIIQFFPCGHCGFVKDILYPNDTNRSGRCRQCRVPFAVILHYARGLCKRDYMAMLRNTPQKAERLQ